MGPAPIAACLRVKGELKVMMNRRLRHASSCVPTQPSSGIWRRMICRRFGLQQCQRMPFCGMWRFRRLPNCSQLVTVSHSISLALYLLDWRSRWHVPTKRRFIINPHSTTSQKTAYFIVTAVNTSNPTTIFFIYGVQSAGWFDLGLTFGSSPRESLATCRGKFCRAAGPASTRSFLY
jgi:hypothetical protein